MRKVVVAIDGPAGAGKSSVSRAVARALGFRYVDTGAMYRVVGVLAAERGIAVDDAEALAALCDAIDITFEERGDVVGVMADGRDLTTAVRTLEAGQLASKVSAVPAVRERLVARQQQLAAAGEVVMEGRDIGTVVCPGAPVKVFLEAVPQERARRRAAELRLRGEIVDLDRMTREIEERDRRDQTRAHSPLRPAPDATVIDTSGVRLEEVIDRVLGLVRRVDP